MTAELPGREVAQFIRGSRSGHFTAGALQFAVDALEVRSISLANTHSAKKRIRQNEKRRVRNKAVRTRTRSYIKRAQQAIEEGNAEAAAAAVKLAVSEIDRAKSKGILHHRNAARRKSRLMKRLAPMLKSK
jgi:small subunit ribosomal protein S20